MNIRTVTVTALAVLLAMAAPFPAQAQEQSDNEVARAEELLNHVRTYHWLGRAKSSDSADFRTARQYAERALKVIENESSPEAIRLQEVAEAAIQELQIRYDNNYDNVVNLYPLFRILTGNAGTYEFVDDADVVAVTRAVGAAVNAMPPTRSDFQFQTVVTSSPVNQPLEDEVRYVLGTDPRFFPRAAEDVLLVVDTGAAEDLYDLSTAPPVLEKLCEAWNKNELLLVHLLENDVVDDVYYYGVDFHLWNRQNGGFTHSLYADGFAQDRRGAVVDVLLTAVALALLSVAAPFICRALLLFQPKKDRGGVHPMAGTAAWAVATVASFLVVRAAAIVAPAPDTLAVQPAVVLWVVGLPVVQAGMAVVAVYFALFRVPGIRDRLSGAQTIAALVAGTILGTGGFLLGAYVVRFGFDSALPYAAAVILVALFGGAWTGEGLFQAASRNRSIGWFPAALTLLAVPPVLFGIMRANQLIPLVAAVVVTGGYVVGLVGRRGVHMALSARRKQAQEQAQRGGLNALSDLRRLVNGPEHYVDPLLDGSFIETAAAGFLDFLKQSADGKGRQLPVYTILIEGPAGSGKTRTAREIARGILDAYATEFGKPGPDPLFGDCDEMNADGSGVPFEPFAQAFHDLLGAGRFEPPAKRAAKVARGLQSVGLETALGAVGLGALSSLMGIDEESADGPVTQATTGEMAHTVSQTLIELTRSYQAPAILILDDIHWIDQVTAELLKGVLESLMSAAGSDRVVLLFTADPDRMDGTATSSNEEAAAQDESQPGYATYELIKRLGEAGGLHLITYGKEDIANPSRFDELLIDGLYFDADAAYRVLQSIDQYDPDTPRAVLQSISSLLDMDGLDVDTHHKTVRLRPGFDLNKIPPPDSLSEAVLSRLEYLTEEQRSIVECAAFVGYEFNAQILADVLKMDRLRVLHQLRILENERILHDVIDQDDVYAFDSTALAAAIRHYANIHQTVEGAEVPQVVREYHHRVAVSLIGRMERFGETIDTIPINDLVALAKRSWAAGDRMLEQAFQFNKHAAERTRRLARYAEAAQFARQAIDCAGKLRTLRDREDVLQLYLLMASVQTSMHVPYRTVVEPLNQAEALLEHLKDPQEKHVLQAQILILRGSAINEAATAGQDDRDVSVQSLRSDARRVLSQLKTINAGGLPQQRQIQIEIVRARLLRLTADGGNDRQASAAADGSAQGADGSAQGVAAIDGSTQDVAGSSDDALGSAGSALGSAQGTPSSDDNDHITRMRTILAQCDAALQSLPEDPEILRSRSEALEDIGIELSEQVATDRRSSNSDATDDGTGQDGLPDRPTWQEALKVLDRALKAKQNPLVNDQEGVAKVQTYIAEAHLNLQDPEQAVATYECALSIAERVNIPAYVAQAALRLGELLQERAPDRSAEYYARVLRVGYSDDFLNCRLRSLTGLLTMAVETSDASLADEYVPDARRLLQRLHAEAEVEASERAVDAEKTRELKKMIELATTSLL